MSYRVLKPHIWAANSMAPGGGSVALATSSRSPIAAEPCLTSKLTSNLLRARRIEASISQKRKYLPFLLSQTFKRCPLPNLHNLDHFHQTTARPSLMIGCLAVVGSIALVRLYTGHSRLPPHTWARTADEQTRNKVEMSTAIAFKTARNAPINQRNNKLRDATFQVPRQLARLNKEAPYFHLEDLGPLAEGKITWDFVFHKSTGGPPLNAKTETRAFLYFPNGSPKATAVFLAVNSEIKYPKKILMQSEWPNLGDAMSLKPISLLRAFTIAYKEWDRSRPSLIDRIAGVQRLPVICNFQEHAFGSVYYPSLGLPGIPNMAMMPLDITDLGLKTSPL